MLKSDVKNAEFDPSYNFAMEEMGDRIKRCRTLRDLTLDTVAGAIGITASALSQWENGQTIGIRPENFLRWCAYFNVDPYQIVFARSRDNIIAETTGRFRRPKF